MKQKSNKQVIKKKSEFRFRKIETINKRGRKRMIRHPTYIFYEKGNLYIYVPLTHSSKVTNRVVIRLRINPNPRDPQLSYRVKEVSEDTKDRFGRRRKGWKMDKQDDLDIREEYKKR